jgi:hypothetical protein
MSKRMNEDKNLSNMEMLAFRTIDHKNGMNKKVTIWEDLKQPPCLV